MRISTLPAGLLWGSPLCWEYAADEALQAERALLAATIDEGPFEALYADGHRGQPGWPTGVLVRALVVQRQHGWHDRELVRQMQDNCRVRVLLGLPLGTREAPSKTVLGDFRRAVIGAGMGVELWAQQMTALAPSGLIDVAQDDFALDSTPLLAAVAQPTVIGLLEHAVRRVLLPLVHVDSSAAAELARRWPVGPWMAKRFSRCSSGVSGRAGQRRWRKCFRLANRVLEAVRKLPEHPKLAGPLRTLARVLEERGADGLGRPQDRLTNALDTDARFGRKGHAPHKITWHGYKASVAMHVPTGLLLAPIVDPANRPDGEALGPSLDRIAAGFADHAPGRLHADSAYTARELRAEATLRRTVLIGPRLGKRRRGRVRGGGRVARRADRAVRAQVERGHAQLVRIRDNRRSWYLGLDKTDYQLSMSVVANNLQRLLALLLAHRLELSPKLRALT